MKLHYDTEASEALQETSILLVMFTGKNGGYISHSLGIVLEHKGSVIKEYRRVGVASNIPESAFNETEELIIKIV